MEIETLIFVRNLSDIAIAEICWERTGSNKIRNLNSEKEHDRSNNYLCFIRTSIF